MSQLWQIESICHHYFLGLLLLFYFLAFQENLYLIHHDLNLFYKVCNTVNQHYQKLVNFLSLFLLILFWCLCKRELKSLSIVSSVSLPIKVYKLPLLLCIIPVWSEYLEEIKLIVIVNWIFHSPWVLKPSFQNI